MAENSDSTPLNKVQKKIIPSLETLQIFNTYNQQILTLLHRKSLHLLRNKNIDCTEDSLPNINYEYYKLDCAEMVNVSYLECTIIDEPYISGKMCAVVVRDKKMNTAPVIFEHFPSYDIVDSKIGYGCKLRIGKPLFNGSFISVRNMSDVDVVFLQSERKINSCRRSCGKEGRKEFACSLCGKALYCSLICKAVDIALLHLAICDKSNVVLKRE